MNEPLISLIIPFYNAENFLQRAVESVINQTYNNIEILLIDDGSQDDSKKIAQEICDKNANCKLFEIENSGPGIARNIGIENSKGEYVVFLDADDEYHKLAIEKLFENMISSSADLCIGMYTMLDSNGETIKSKHWNHSLNLSNLDAISMVVEGKLIPTSWGKLFKKSIIENCKFPDLNWKEDDVFMLNYLLLSDKVSIIKDSLISIHSRSNSLTRQLISKKMIDGISSSYHQQNQLLRNNNLGGFELGLLKSEMDTYVSLFLIIKIDWEKIKDREGLLRMISDKVNLIGKRTQKFKIGIKKRLILWLLNLPKILGWKITLFLLKKLKRKRILEINKLRS